MKFHVCRFCGEKKSYEMFDKKIKDGPLEEWNLRRCKECSHSIYLQRYQNPESRKALNNASSNWKRNNPEHHAYLAREYRLRNKEKTIAQNRLNYAIRKGVIKRLPCQICGTTERVHAHHVSYREKDWYNVKWLCYVCHKMQH